MMEWVGGRHSCRSSRSPRQRCLDFLGASLASARRGPKPSTRTLALAIETNPMGIDPDAQNRGKR